MSLEDRIADVGFTPSVRHLEALLDLVAGDDEDLARNAARAILRIEPQHGARLATKAVERARASVRPARGRLTALAGQLTRARGRDPEGTARAWLLEALGDADPKTRRGAARALGKLDPSASVGAALAEAFDRAPTEDDAKVLAEALARTGGPLAKSRLAGGHHVRATLIADREAAREAPGRIDPAGPPSRPVAIRFHTRSGLEPILQDELGTAFGATKLVAPGVVEGTLTGPLESALAVRTATHVGFPLEPTHGDDVAAAVVDRLTSPEGEAVLRAFTSVDPEAPIRFRVVFVRGGHHRAVAWRCAELVRARSRPPLLVNDPRGSTWEVAVDASIGPAGRVPVRNPIKVELVPRGYDDPRFAYRRELVAASSHPVIAAALARIAPRRADDVVWDPFAGAGAELVERARLGPFARLVGTDRDPRAVAASRQNLAAAGVDATVDEGDACEAAPEGVTLILTNPPMGRRVERGGHLGLLERFVDHAAKVLRPGGALVWLVPEPKRLNARAEAAGLVLESAITVDMGGFPASLSTYRKNNHRKRRGSAG